MSTSGDFMSKSEGYHDVCGGYHEYTGGCSIHQGFQYKVCDITRLIVKVL